MAKVRMPDEAEQDILRANGVDPNLFGVTFRDEDIILLLNYKTRDTVAIRKGDRPW